MESEQEKIPRRVRALHPRDWQFVDDKGLDRIIEYTDVSELDTETKRELGGAIEATNQSLVSLWGKRPQALYQTGDQAGRRRKWFSQGRPKNYALDVFFESLIANYSIAFDRRPGTSIDSITNDPRGPLIRFLGACCDETHRRLESPEALGIEVSVAEAIRRKIAPFKTNSGLAGKEALRKRVKRSRLGAPQDRKAWLARVNRRIKRRRPKASAP